MKQMLAHWISLALQKALSAKNIRSGFQGTGIWPFNAEAVHAQCQPAEAYARGQLATTDVAATDTQNGTSTDPDDEEGNDGVPVAEHAAVDLQQEIPDPSVEHYFVDADPTNLQQPPDVRGVDPQAGPVESVTCFLSLPTLAPRVSSRVALEPLDFTRSLMLTFDDYINVVSRKRQA